MHQITFDAITVSCGPTGQWEAVWACTGCGGQAYFSWPKAPTAGAIAALAADARCYRCRRRDAAAPVQLSLKEA